MPVADDRLVPIALALLDGDDVDWGRATTSLSDPDERDLIQALQALQGVVRAGGGEGPPRAWGDLRLVEKIGSGIFGDVYRAWDDRLGREVAVKLLRALPDGADAGPQLDEARRLAQIKHPGIVTVYGADRRSGRVGFWMELLHGQTLSRVLQEQGRFGAREAALVGLDLCRALAAVHAAGLVHRDVKADNVIREEGGRTVLTDFGAGAMPAAGDTDVIGTPLYAAPEVLDGAPPSPDADLYGLGVLLYHLVTAKYPVAGTTLDALREAHVGGRRTWLRDARPDLPPAFVQVVEKALAPRGERFQTAGEMEGALAGVLESARPAASGRVAVVAAAGVIAAVASIASFRPRAPAVPASSSSAPAVADRAPLAVHLFRAGSSGEPRPLGDGDRVAAGDRLFLELEPPFDTYLYVVDEDERGNAFLLFPLPGQELQNPLPGKRLHHLPGPGDGRQLDWQVTSAGGHEHILIFASRERQPAFEQVIARLPLARLGHSASAAELPPGALGPLRGIGGLVEVTADGAGRDVRPLARRLAGDVARGPWLREIVLANPSS